MPIEKAIIKRINTLIEQGKPISPVGKKGYGITTDEEHIISGWLTSAIHVVELVVGSASNAYTKQCIHVKTAYDFSDAERLNASSKKSECVGKLVSVLESLLTDIEAGMISSIVDQVRAETFDDFLDHAEKYYKEKRKESGVIAGVVFEDTIRRIGKNNGKNNSQLEDIINGLARDGVLSKVKAKRAKVASDVRTRATHAQWDKFELSDVKATIDFTRELISAHLDG